MKAFDFDKVVAFQKSNITKNPSYVDNGIPTSFIMQNVDSDFVSLREFGTEARRASEQQEFVRDLRSDHVYFY